MGLPITEYPLSEIYVHSLKEKVQFRPFLVKEEKLLVLAAESGEAEDMVKASQQIVTNCSFGKVEGDKIPIFDMQKIFIELRKMSVGDTVEAVFACGVEECQEKATVVIDLNDFELKEDESHSPTIQLTEGLSIEMRYPKTEELKEIAGTNTHAEIYSTAAKCIDKIYMEDAVYTAEETSFEERLEFIENLTSDAFENVRNFFETMPVMEHTIEFQCKKCGKVNYAFMNGYLDFFV
tara:strand:+ start:21 stop:728 length:708 start_codon:yes stop_codon:yes gene_type:complete